jgi:magnesium-transporting ATPase (P-type)
MLRTLRYLLASQSSRLLIVLASIIGGTTLLSPVQLLFCGLILDFGAVIVMAFERPERDILRSRSDVEAQLKNPIRHCIDSLFFGIIWAAITIALPHILSAFGIALNASQISSVTFICSAFTQLAVLAEIKRDKTIFRSFSFNGVQMIYASVVLLITLIGLLFPSFGLTFGIVRIPAYAFAASMALPLISILIFELYRLALPSLKPAIKAFNEKGGVVSVFSAGFKVDDISDDERYTEEEILEMSSGDETLDSESEQTDITEEKSDEITDVEEVKSDDNISDEE